MINDAAREDRAQARRRERRIYAPWRFANLSARRFVRHNWFDSALRRRIGIERVDMTSPLAGNGLSALSLNAQRPAGGGILHAEPLSESRSAVWHAACC